MCARTMGKLHYFSTSIVIKDKGMAVTVVDIMTKGAGEWYGAGEVAGRVQAYWLSVQS